MTGRFFYRVSGWTVASPRALPYLLPADDAGAAADIEVRFSPLESLEAAESPIGPFHIHGPRLVDMRTEAGIEIRIADGRTLQVAPHDGVTDGELHTLLFGPALAVLSQQRGQPALHAAAVTREGPALGICGHQGAGKSTTVRALIGRGYGLMSDDQLVTDAAGANAFPSYPFGKLWTSSGPVLGTSVSGEAVARGVEKFHVSAEDVFCAETRPLGAIAVLVPTPELDAPEAQLLTPGQAAAVLHRMVHYGPIGLRMGCGTRNMAWMTRIARNVPVHIVRRTGDPAQLDQLLDILETCLDRDALAA